ncbi:uncharacterized protein LOC108825903 isoform X1 [Raphanus sativus]|uniref:Uncharacterized protein LOC108825903 isoform X1 n=1 Tax=Raphanus sativus TaxID=3726 RepID=A0A9W3CG21_RAPSA|nr:uncharacterized protein LOC108825903 isoform X1 [Raphanus sativus]
MSSLDYRPPSFICLVVKNKADYWFPKKTVGETTYFIIDNSYISDVQYENTSNSHHLQPVLGCNNKEGERSDQYCWACRSYKIENQSFPLYIIQKGMSIPSITFQEKHHLLAMFVHLMIPKVASTLVFNVILLSIEDVSTCHTSYEYLVTTTVFLLPVLFLSEILGFAEFVAERWMKTMDHILAQRIAPMQCTLTVLLCSMYGLVKNSRAKQSWKMTILSRRLRRWMMGLYDILGMRTIA